MSIDRDAHEGTIAYNGDVIVCANVPQHFAEFVVERFVSRSPQRLFPLVLSGGGVHACYAALADATTIDWPEVAVFWGDERLVPRDHEDSNYLLAQDALFTPLSHHAKNTIGAIYPMVGTDSNVVTAADYAADIRAHLPLGVVHLGMGVDGHTASLFPSSPALDVWNELVLDTGDDLHTHPRRTLSYAAIAQSHDVVFTVMGSSKAQMLRRVFAERDVPATRVISRSVTWLVDPDAAQFLVGVVNFTTCESRHSTDSIPNATQHPTVNCPTS